MHSELLLKVKILKMISVALIQSIGRRDFGQIGYAVLPLRPIVTNEPVTTVSPHSDLNSLCK